MKKNRRRMMATAVAAAMAVSMLAGGMVQADEGTTLNVALTNPFTGAGAINIANPYRFATLSQVYESMLSLNNGEYEGILLKEWKQSEPGVWDLTLYDGITDSEGNPFTADDVKWAMNAQKDSGNEVGRYYEKDCVEVVDDTHLKLHLDTDSEGVFYLIGTQLIMCTQEAYDASEDHLATKPVGTGPYVCEEYVEGSSCTLAKRADYWKTESVPRASQANFDTIDISFVPEATQMAIAIESGDVNLAGQVDMSISGEADSADGMSAYYTTNGTYNGLAFNMNGREISTNKALREAICLGIDNEGIIQAIYKGHAQEMTTYGMDTCSDFNPEWTCSLGYDPEAAMAKLEEAGIGSGTEIVFLVNNVGEDAQMAELIQGYLAGIGLTVTMDYVDPATLNSRIAEGNWDINLAGGSGVLDMSLFWGNLYRKNDSGMSKYFHNDEALYNIFDAFNAIGGKTDENNQALYEYEAENVTWYPMFNKEVLYVYNSEYTNLVVNDAYMSLPYLGTLN